MSFTPEDDIDTEELKVLARRLGVSVETLREYRGEICRSDEIDCINTKNLCDACLRMDLLSLLPYNDPHKSTVEKTNELIIRLFAYFRRRFEEIAIKSKVYGLDMYLVAKKFRQNQNIQKILTTPEDYAHFIGIKLCLPKCEMCVFKLFLSLLYTHFEDKELREMINAIKKTIIGDCVIVLTVDTIIRTLTNLEMLIQPHLIEQALSRGEETENVNSSRGEGSEEV